MKKQIAFRYKLDSRSAETWVDTNNQEIQILQPNQLVLPEGITLIPIKPPPKPTKRGPQPFDETKHNNIVNILKAANDVDFKFPTSSLIPSKPPVDTNRFMATAPFVDPLKKYKCCWCLQWYSSLKEIKDHDCKHVFVCTDCPDKAVFKSRKALAAHLRVKHIFGYHKCTECKFVGSTKTYLDRHYDSAHKTATTNTDAPVKNVVTPETPSSQAKPTNDNASPTSSDKSVKTSNVAGKKASQSTGDIIWDEPPKKKTRKTSANKTSSNILANGTFIGNVDDLPEDVVNVAETLQMSTSNDNDSIADHSEDVEVRDSSLDEPSESEFNLSISSVSSIDDVDPARKNQKMNCKKCGRGYVKKMYLLKHEKICTGVSERSTRSRKSPTSGLPQPKQVSIGNGFVETTIGENGGGEASTVIQQTNSNDESSDSIESQPEEDNHIKITFKSHKERMRDLLSGMIMSEGTSGSDTDTGPASSTNQGQELCKQCLRRNYPEPTLNIHLRKCKGTFHLKKKFKCPFCREPKMLFGTETSLNHHILMRHAHEQAQRKWNRIKMDKREKKMAAFEAQGIKSK